MCMLSQLFAADTFDISHVGLVLGLTAVISVARVLSLQAIPEFASASDQSNRIVGY